MGTYQGQHGSLSREQAGALGRFERDGGSIDIAEPMPTPPSQQEPTVINVGWLPSEQPMCPYCFVGLHPVRQNAQGDSLFECVQGGCVGDGYMAVYRVQGPKWEQFQGRGIYPSWKQPVRFADIERMKRDLEAPPVPEPTEKPQGAWPETKIEGVERIDTTPVNVEPIESAPKIESKSVQRRKAIQRGAKVKA